MSSGIDLVSSADTSAFEPKLETRQLIGKIFAIACLLSTLVGLVILAALIVDVVQDGLPRLDSSLLTQYPSRKAIESGYKAALWGSVWMLAYVLVLAVPIGVGSAIYLEEYAPKNWLTDFIELNIYNLAGVPSIVYGILGLGLFVRGLYSGRAVLVTGILTIALLILPPIIVVAREAIRAVPQSIRQASYGVGATKWQTIRHHVLPVAMPGILTGVIISTSRGVGETAPLVVLGAGTVLFTPKAAPINLGALLSGRFSELFKDTIWSSDNFFSVLPYQIYEWVGDPKADFQTLASAGIILLMLLVLGMNAIAIVLRGRSS
jgi:phosphate transport system permease protein